MLRVLFLPAKAAIIAIFGRPITFAFQFETNSPFKANKSNAFLPEDNLRT